MKYPNDKHLNKSYFVNEAEMYSNVNYEGKSGQLLSFKNSYFSEGNFSSKKQNILDRKEGRIEAENLLQISKLHKKSESYNENSAKLAERIEDTVKQSSLNELYASICTFHSKIFQLSLIYADNNFLKKIRNRNPNCNHNSNAVHHASSDMFIQKAKIRDKAFRKFLNSDFVDGNFIGNDSLHELEEKISGFFGAISRDALCESTKHRHLLELHRKILLNMINSNKINHEQVIVLKCLMNNESELYDEKCNYCQRTSSGITYFLELNKKPSIQDVYEYVESKMINKQMVSPLFIVQKKLNAKYKAAKPLSSDNSIAASTIMPSTPIEVTLANPKFASKKIIQIKQSSSAAVKIQQPKEKTFEMKVACLNQLFASINLSNSITITYPQSTFVPYKYSVGCGNNSILIKQALKSRWWWGPSDSNDYENFNFIWTQWKSAKVLATFKPHAFAQQQIETQESPTPLPQQLADKKLNTESKKFGPSNAIRICNHLEANYHISNKKALYYNMRAYYDSINEDVFSVLPLTFHIKDGVEDSEFKRFEEYYNGLENEIEQEKDIVGLKKKRNLWIIKPGEETNRGTGINVCKEISQIKDIVSATFELKGGSKRSYIIQKYMDRPLLYNKRKFDIRCFTLVTSVNGNLNGYWYQEGYIRTACKEFSIKNLNNKIIHLTNDAIQKKADDYGKFENGNKLSYLDFQKYIDNHSDMKLNMLHDIVPQLKNIATDTIKSIYNKMDPQRLENSFEIFGYDFMIDENLKVWLIEVNTNPCLELSSTYLSRLIPSMVENAIKIAVDPLFPPPPWPSSKKHILSDSYLDNKFELIFNESKDASQLKNLPVINELMGDMIEEDEEDDDNKKENEEVVSSNEEDI